MVIRALVLKLSPQTVAQAHSQSSGSPRMILVSAESSVVDGGIVCSTTSLWLTVACAVIGLPPSHREE